MLGYCGTQKLKLITDLLTFLSLKMLISIEIDCHLFKKNSIIKTFDYFLTLGCKFYKISYFIPQPPSASDRLRLRPIFWALNFRSVEFEKIKILMSQMIANVLMAKFKKL